MWYNIHVYKVWVLHCHTALSSSEPRSSPQCQVQAQQSQLANQLGGFYRWPGDAAEGVTRMSGICWRSHPFFLGGWCSIGTCFSNDPLMSYDLSIFLFISDLQYTILKIIVTGATASLSWPTRIQNTMRRELLVMLRRVYILVRQAGMESPAVIDELDDLLIEYGRNRSYIYIYI